MSCFRMIGAFACLVLSATGVFAQKPTRWGDLHGVVVDTSGAPVADVLIVASGVGFRGRTLCRSGATWGDGLPLEKELVGSQSITVRSWEYNGAVDLDLSGQTKDGKRWRWLGESSGDIAYSGVSKESADSFDSMIETTCRAVFVAPKK